MYDLFLAIDSVFMASQEGAITQSSLGSHRADRGGYVVES
jgi:hypothetical protein